MPSREHTRPIVNTPDFGSPLLAANSDSECVRDVFAVVLFVILGICACMHFSFRYGSRWSLVAQWMLSIFTTALCQWITHSAQTTKKVNSSCAKKSVLMEFCALHRLPKMSFRFDAVIAIYVLRQTSKWPFTIFRFWRVDWNQECRRRIVTSTQCTYLRPGLIALPTIQSHSSCSCRWSADNWRILRRIIIDTYSYVKGTKCTLIAANEIKREKNAANRLIESLIPSLVHIYFITYYRCAAESGGEEECRIASWMKCRAQLHTMANCSINCCWLRSIDMAFRFCALVIV